MNYKNITISGLPGSGSTTLLRLLKAHFVTEKWKAFSGGDFMRAYALEKGIFRKDQGLHHDASHYEDDFDRQIDFGMREKLTTSSHWILESWLSGFMAQGVDGTLKVLLQCSNDAVRVDRIVNRDQVTVEEALVNIRKRTENNTNKWIRIYAKEWSEWVVKNNKAKQGELIDFWAPSLYDVVVDTYSTNKDQTLQVVLDKLGV